MNKTLHTFENNLSASLIENATEGIIVVNKSGVIVYANSASHVMFEYELGTLKGKKIDALVPMNSNSSHKKYRDQYHTSPVKKPMGHGRDLKGKLSSGKVFPVEISLTPIDINGDSFVAAMITDISTRKALEDRVIKMNETLEVRVQEKIKEVRRSQHLYDAVARNYPNGTISVIDNDFNYILVEGKELFELNITSEALRGSSYLNQMPEEVRPEVKSRFELALKGENQDFELSYGGEFYRIDAVPIQFIGEESDSILVVEQNISVIRKALDKERDLNELKSRFVSMASHEFRTPLSTIASSSDLAHEHYTRGNQDKATRHLKRIRESVTHMVAILDDYLSLEKFEGGSWNDKFEIVDFKKLFNDVVSDQTKIIKPSQSIDFTYNIKSLDEQMSLIIAVKGIAMNLISNASKYSKDGSVIGVHFSEIDSDWELKVEDEGIGINKEEQSLVFKQFFRSDRTSHIPGTGVGLDLVQRYVKALGGKVSLKSEVGVGSTFIAIWPKQIENRIKSW